MSIQRNMLPNVNASNSIWYLYGKMHPPSCVCVYVCEVIACGGLRWNCLAVSRTGFCLDWREKGDLKHRVREQKDTNLVEGFQSRLAFTFGVQHLYTRKQNWISRLQWHLNNISNLGGVRKSPNSVKGEVKGKPGCWAEGGSSGHPAGLYSRGVAGGAVHGPGGGQQQMSSGCRCASQQAYFLLESLKAEVGLLIHCFSILFF